MNIIQNISFKDEHIPHLNDFRIHRIGHQSSWEKQQQQQKLETKYAMSFH